MAKKNEQAQSVEETEVIGGPEAPEDMRPQSDSVEGYWEDEKSAILCIPRFARVFDGNIVKERPSLLIVVELTAPTTVSLKIEGEDEYDVFTAEKGRMVGVWGKPGMRAIKDLCGVEVWMKRSGVKNTGKGNPMITYDIRAKQLGTRIPITEDTRDYSEGVPTFLEDGYGKRARRGGNAQPQPQPRPRNNQEDVADDEPPF